MKKILILFVVLLTLVACGSKEQDVETLKVTMALSEEEWEVMRNEIFPDFEEETGIKVEGIQVEASDVVSQLEAMKNANKMEIDVVAQDVNNTTLLVEKDLVEDLTEYKDIIPEETFGELAESGLFEDKLFFMPYRPNVEINYYNSKYFDQYGLSAPTNWDELLEVAKTLYSEEGTGKVALKIKLSGDVIEIAEFIRAAGGDVLDLRSEGTKIAYTYLQELWPYLSENTLKAGFSSTNDFLAKEEVYYAPNWPFGVNIIVKDGGKEEILTNEGFSGPEGLVKTLGGEVLGITKDTTKKAEAIKFIEYLQSQKVQETLLLKNGWPSFRNDVYGNVEDWQKPYFDSTTKALEKAVALPNVPYWGEINQALNDSLKEIVLDGKNVEETLEKYAESMDKVISQYE